VKTKQKTTPSTGKVRRDVTGGKRGKGNQARPDGRRPRARRGRVDNIGMGSPDRTVTGVGGLVAFASYVSELGVDAELQRGLSRLKTHPAVVYPMAFQVRLLMDLLVAGETRPFGIESLASDPVIQRLAGGMVPSVDTLYDDLARFDQPALDLLEAMVAAHGLASLAQCRAPWVHLDIDTTVLPSFGEKDGARPGPNPKYRGRPSFHPMLARIAETDMLVGMQLRPGDTGFGWDDLPTLRGWVSRAKAEVRRGSHLCLRMDAAGDFGGLLAMLDEEQVFYVIKAKTTADVLGLVETAPTWSTTDRDADGEPTRQTCELPFSRDAWKAEGLTDVRVIAVRSRDRHGKQLALLDEVGWTVQLFLSNRPQHEAASDIAWDYDGRAGVEPLIAELKGAWGLADASAWSFTANHAVVLLKALTRNLLCRYRVDRFPTLRRWHTDWLRRVLICVPGRILRSGRRTTLRLLAGSPLLPRAA